MRARRRRRFALVSLLLFAIPGLPLLAEAGLRLRLASRRSGSALWQERVAAPRQRVETEMAPKGALWEEGQTWKQYKKNASIEDAALGVSFHTNSHGFRGAEFSQVPSAGVFRIAVLGGSTTVLGPTDQSTWPAVLERTLAAEPLAPPWTRIEVLNLAVSGADIALSHQRLAEVEPFRPHALFVYEAVNSIKGRRPFTRWPEWLQAFELHDLLCAGGRDPRVLLETYGAQFVHLKQIGEWCQARAIPLFVATFAIPERKDFTPEEWEFLDLHARYFFIGRGIDHYAWSVRVWNDFLRVWARDRVSRAPFLLLDLEPELKGPFFHDPCHLDGAGLAKQGELTARLLRPHLARGGVIAAPK